MTICRRRNYSVLYRALNLHPLRFQIIALKDRNKVIVRYLEDKEEREQESPFKTNDRVLANKMPKNLKAKKKRAYQRALRYEVIGEFRYQE